MDNFKIVDPIFLDLEKTIVRFTLVDELGSSKIAEFKVPPNKEKGINKYWDRIVEEFDIEVMREKRNSLEMQRINEKEHLFKKQKAQEENTKLIRLFEAKAEAFEYFFIKEAPPEIKSSVRKAPTVEIIRSIISIQMQKYMEENGLTISDIVDKLND